MPFDGKYLDWNQKRIKAIIDYYGHKFFFGKRILDLGCGYADLSCVLHRLGADITAVDARQDHLKIVGKKYNGIKTVKVDLDINWPFVNKKFDLTLDLDLLCHLHDYEKHLKSVCASCTHLILETTVCDSADDRKCYVLQENKNVYDLSVNGVSSRPSAAAIERVLTECGMNFTRIDQAKINSGKYVYDWVAVNDESCDIDKRRFWFAVKKDSPEQFDGKSHAIITTPHVVTIGATKVDLHERNKHSGIMMDYRSNIKVTTPSPSLAAELKKLKVAVCISGHLRTFESNYKSVKQFLLDRYDCDVFVHTWDILGMSYRWLDSNLYLSKTEKLVQIINNLYSPKKLIIEPSKSFQETPLMRKQQLDHRDIPGILSMYYKIEACNNLKKDYEQKNNIKYDFVIRFRGDLFLEDYFPISHAMDPRVLYFPAYGNFGGLNDQLAWGGSDVMDVYSSLYSNINNYLSAGAPMHPERLLKYFIDHKGVPVSKVDVKYVIKRANGLVQNNYLLERAQGFVK